MEQDKLISIIIPVYNPGDYLFRCLESVVTQTYSNLEIILIDDGSTDGSSSICDFYKEKDERIICIHKTNGGVSSARNAGLEVATGDFFHFLDSDDYLEPNAYEYLVSIINQNKCEAVVFEYFITYTDSEITHILQDEFYGISNGEETLRKILAGKMLCCDKFYSKNIIQGLKFREDIHRGEDTLFAVQALSHTEKVWFDKRALYHYVQSENSACRGVFRENQLTVLKLYDAYAPILEKHREVDILFFIFMQEILISLYYDIWSDKNSYQFKQGKRNIYAATVMYLKKIKKTKILTMKQRIKFNLFNSNPNLFCMLHRVIHRL